MKPTPAEDSTRDDWVNDWMDFLESKKPLSNLDRDTVERVLKKLSKRDLEDMLLILKDRTVAYARM